MPAKCMPKGAKVRTLQAAMYCFACMRICIHIQQTVWHLITSAFACKSVGVHVKMQPETADIDRAAVALIIMSNHFAVAAPQNVSQNCL